MRLAGGGGAVPGLLLLLIAPAVAQPTLPAPAVDEVLADRAIERALTPGQRHVYRLGLDAGQAVRVSLEPRVAAIEATLLTPEGRTASAYHSEHRPEPLASVADQRGEYRIVITATSGSTRPQRYRISPLERRPGEPPDRQRAVAERAVAEGLRLFATRTRDGMQKALRPLEEALHMWESVGDQRQRAGVLALLGEIRTGLGEPRTGLELGQRALSLIRDTSERDREADVLSTIAMSHFYLEQWAEAAAHYERAVVLYREAGYVPGLAQALHNLGSVHDSRGDVSSALDAYGEALSLVRELGNRSSEATLLNSIGGTQVAAGEPQAAFESFVAALAIRRTLGERRLVAFSLHNLGTLEHGLGRMREAAAHFNEALPIWRAVGDASGEGATLMWLARVAQATGQRRRALEHVDASLQRFRATSNRVGEATVLQLSAQLSLEVGRHQAARRHADASLTLCRAIAMPRCQSFALVTLGRAETAAGAFDEADAHLRAALEIQRASADAGGQILATVAAARLEQARGRAPAALAHAEASLDLIDAMRGRLAVREHRSSLLAGRYEAYELAVELSMDMDAAVPDGGYAARAFEVNERSRARSLLELLAEAGADVRGGVDPDLLQEERRLQQRLSALDTKRLRVLERPGQQASSAEPGAEIERVRLQLEEIRGRIRTRSPRYAALTMPRPIAVAELQREILDDDAVLLQYSLGPRRSYLWVVDRRTIRSYTLPAKADIEAAARRVRQLLPFSGERRRQREVERALGALSQQVLTPARAALRAKRIAIVADGALQFIPFAALRLDGEPLIARAEVVHLPSATTLALLRRDHTRRSPAPKLVAVFADPVLSTADSRVPAASARRVSSSTARTPAVGPTAPLPVFQQSQLTRASREAGIGSLNRLLFTRREARLIAALAGSSNASIALGFEASRQRVVAGGLDGFRIVHFATHGLVNDRHPDLSGLVLSLVDRQGRPQDGFLRLHDIYNLRLHADLVVLSACRTALGEEIRGEGLVGLVRGFMYAGAPRVVASLWDVRDDATAELMRRFYAAMIRDGLAPAAALRAAQLSMSQHPRWRAPYFWAGFALQGDWR